MKDAARMTGHYIVCGCGITGEVILEELLETRHDVVVVELTSSDGAALAVCSFRDDTGAGTVPVGTFDVPGSGRLSLHRVRTSEFSAGDVDLGELRFDFEVAANVSFTP